MPSYPPARSACIAGGLIEAVPARRSDRVSARVPPVLQAASLKRKGLERATGGAEGVPPVLQAASLKRMTRRRPARSPAGVPPVLQAASLKPDDEMDRERNGEAFRLYCRRPH